MNFKKKNYICSDKRFDRKLSRDIIRSIKRVLSATAPDGRAYIYGSQARGDARPDSDIDLLILLPDTCEGKEFVRKKIDISGGLYDLSLSEGIDISPLILLSKTFFARKTPFTVNVINEGIAI